MVGRRRDYHLTETIAAFISLADNIEFRRADTFSLKVDGDYRVAADETNLVWRAAKLLDENPKLAIRLTKHIPTKAGLGGGSADAAATLLTLATDGRGDLRRLAAQLGSDVGLCLKSPTPGFHGEDGFEAVNLPSLYAVLVYTPPGLSTASVYAAHGSGAHGSGTHGSGTHGSGDDAQPSRARLSRDFPKTAADWGAYCRGYGNSLLESAVGLMPSLKPLLQSLTATRNCLYAGLSGSGSSCFALYESRSIAAAAAQELREGGGGLPNRWSPQLVEIYGFNASTNTE